MTATHLVQNCGFLTTTCLGALQLSLLEVGAAVTPTLIYRSVPEPNNTNARSRGGGARGRSTGRQTTCRAHSVTQTSRPISAAVHHRDINKLVLVDRNSLPLLSPGTWTRHNVGQALDFGPWWATLLPGPRGRLPSGHVGGCSDPLVSKPPVLAPVASRRLVPVTTREVPPGPWVAPAPRQLASFPASPCAWEKPSRSSCV